MAVVVDRSNTVSRVPVAAVRFFLFLVMVLFFNGLAVLAQSAVAEPPVAIDPSLADLEPLVKTSAAVLAQAARFEELLAALEHERTKVGWRVVGQLRGGYVDEQLTNDQRREYYPSQISAGLTYPLFDKRQEEKARLLDLQTGIRNEHLQVAIKQRDALESLRLSYILLWAAELKIELAQAFLGDREEKRRMLENRVGTGHLLRADYLEFLSVMDLVDRERAVNLNAAARTRDIIYAVTGINLETPLSHPPDLPASCEEINQAVAKLAEDPEILLYQNYVEREMERRAISTATDIRGDFTVQGVVGSSETVVAESGYGGMVSLNLSMPLNPFAAGSAGKAAQQYRLRRFQRELQAKTEELKLGVKDRFRNRSAERANSRFSLTRLEAATELLREKTLRADHLDGDVLEQLQKARYTYYRVAVDYLEAERRLLNNSVRILRFCPASRKNRVLSPGLANAVVRPLAESPDRVSSVPTIVENLQQQDEQRELAVYIWQSEPLIDGSESVERLKEQQISTVLVSLNAAQLLALRAEEGRELFTQFLMKCRIAGLSPGVLLGEPAWILPEQRHKLLEILNGLNGIPIDRIHLDMEPAQLDFQKYGFTYLAAQLLRTVQLAVEVSDHPIELSLHPRMLSADEIDFCLGCGLSNLDIERVVVMIYRTDFVEVQRKMTAIARSFPALHLAVAQSVETILGPNNSYAHHGQALFQNNLRKLMHGTEQKLWQGDVYLQDWASLKKRSGPQEEEALRR